MNYLIKKGHHYARPLELFKKFLAIRSSYGRSIYAYVTFSNNCKYDIGCEQSDINKLCGFSLGLFHHRNSARVGWRYDRNEKKIELITYVYRNKVRIPEKHLLWCEFNTEYFIRLIASNDRVIFCVDGCTISEEVQVKGISYPLSLYFGGNMTAPHDMNVIMDVNYN